jgi:hypothetical protein
MHSPLGLGLGPSLEKKKQGNKSTKSIILNQKYLIFAKNKLVHSVSEESFSDYSRIMRCISFGGSAVQ